MSGIAKSLLYPWNVDEDTFHGPAERIVLFILRDLTDRKGIRQDWEGIDKDIREEIIDEWLGIARKEVGI